MNEEERSTADEEQGSPGLMDRVKGAFSSGGGDADESREGRGDASGEERGASSGEERSASSGEERSASSGGGGGSRVDTVRNALKAFGGGQPDGFLDALDENVEWSAPSGEHFPGGGSHRGRDAVREQHVDVVSERFEDFGFRPRMFLEGEDQHDHLVVVLGAYRGSGQGGTLDAPAVQVWEFGSDDTATKVHVYADSEHFRRAAGSEAPEGRSDSSSGEPDDRSSGERRGGGDDESEQRGGGDDKPEERGSEASASADAAPEDADTDDDAVEGSGGEEHPTRGSDSEEQTSRE